MGREIDQVGTRGGEEGVSSGGRSQEEEDSLRRR